MNKTMAYITGILIAIFIIVALWTIYNSKDWSEVTGTINNIQIKTISFTSGNIDYKVELDYEFLYKDKKYTGSKLYPIIPNIFRQKKDAEKILNNYKSNSETTIYFDPENPKNSCLISAKSFSANKFILVMIGMLVFVALFIWAFIYFQKLMG